MCLAVPMRLVEVHDPADGARTGTVEYGGLRRRVRLDLLDDPRPGDHLLVHAGFAIQVVDPEEAARTVALLEELLGAAAPPDDEQS